MCPQNGSQDSDTLSFQNFRMTQNNFESIVTEIALLIRAKTFWRKKTITVLWRTLLNVREFLYHDSWYYKPLTVNQILSPFINDSFNLHDNPLKYEDTLSSLNKWRKYGLENSSSNNCTRSDLARNWSWKLNSYSVTIEHVFLTNVMLYCFICPKEKYGRHSISLVNELKWKLQSRPTLCDPMDYTDDGILQARVLEWVAVPFSRGSSQPKDQTQVSCIGGGFFTSWATREAQEYWSGSVFFLQRIFLTQELNWGLLHCRWILYQLSFQGSPQFG